MSGQDGAENLALAAASGIFDQVKLLWHEAHADGIRNGLEAAAIHVDSAAAQLREMYPHSVYEPVAQMLEGLRDEVRLMALQVPDAEVST